MTSHNSDASPPTPQVFTIFSLPSYEDAVKSSGEPPTYEQALTDLRVDDLEMFPVNSLPQTPGNGSLQDPNLARPKNCQRRMYRSFCWGLAVLIILVLGYMIYNGIFRYITNDKKT